MPRMTPRPVASSTDRPARNISIGSSFSPGATSATACLWGLAIAWCIASVSIASSCSNRARSSVKFSI